MRFYYRTLWLLKDYRADLLHEHPRYFYWIPVFMAVGIGAYFSLPFEPGLRFWSGFLLLSTTAILLARRRFEFGYLFIVAIAAVLAGFSAAQLRTLRQHIPLLPYEMGPVRLEGTLVSLESRTEGSRILLEDVTISRDMALNGNWRLRITLAKLPVGELPPPGSRLRVLANITPPAEPADPQGYDFRRQAFFEGISGYGYALGKPEILAGGSVGEWSQLAEVWRQEIADAARQTLHGPEGAIAIALMTGERGDIDEKTNVDMRAAGTAHLLSISGMHIGMVGGLIFYLVRLGLVLLPRIALLWPVKKIAAFSALLGIVAYTWLVGAPVPAERAALMTGLVFVAILLDRISLTLRAVVLAALLILAIQPESLLHPGFQLSFAAITVLVSFYEWGSRQEEKAERSWFVRLRHGLFYLVMTSILAGLVTSPIAAYHFHRFQLMGVLGNLIAVPLTGFIIMPAMLASYVLLPFGLVEWPLRLMQLGLAGVTQSAAWVASLPGANINVPAFGMPALLLMVLGGLWLCIWQRRVRWAGFAPLLLGLLLAAITPQPDILVSSEGVVALRGHDGHFRYSTARADGLTVRNWSLGYDREYPVQSWSKDANGLNCDSLGCRFMQGGQGIALVRRPEALLDDCRFNQIVIAPDVRAGKCGADMVLDRAWLKQYGSTALYWNGLQYQPVYTRTGRGLRPWQPD